MSLTLHNTFFGRVREREEGGVTGERDRKERGKMEEAKDLNVV
jgi:hypothetical protein